jgi:hypothetical protein
VKDTCLEASHPKSRAKPDSTWRFSFHIQMAISPGPTNTSSSFILKPCPSSFLLHNSMLKRLLHSPTLHRFFSHPTKFLSFPGRHPCACACAHFPSVSWPVSPIFPRPIHSLNVLAMAERPSAPASHSHKYTNRLAAEHSPYLLQHAHNPVSGVHLHLHFY